jgi:hypothetical protein
MQDAQRVRVAVEEIGVLAQICQDIAAADRLRLNGTRRGLRRRFRPVADAVDHALAPAAGEQATRAGGGGATAIHADYRDSDIRDIEIGDIEIVAGGVLHCRACGVPGRGRV